VVVFLVGLEMFSQISNPLREECHLDLGRACIALVDSIFINDLSLFLCF